MSIDKKPPVAKNAIGGFYVLNVFYKAYLEAEAKTAFNDKFGLKLMTASIA